MSAATFRPRFFRRWSSLLFVLVGIAVLHGAATKPVGPQVLNTYTTVPAFDGIAFGEPVQVVFAPGEKHRAFVVERAGVIAVVRDLTRPEREVFLDLRMRGRTFDRTHGVLSMAFHPRFAENGFFYVWFSLYEKGQRANRLARFQAGAGHPQRADVASEVPLLTQPTGPGGHDGAMLLFGPDGYLYISLGDGDERFPEAASSRQSIERSFFGAVLRLDVDRRPGSLRPNPHPAVHPDTYAVPPDNPFAGVQFIEAIWDYAPALGMSVTGGFVYRGQAYPDLVGKYLFADYTHGRIWALEPKGDKPVQADRVAQIATRSTIVAFERDPRNDEVLLTSFGEGQIFRLVKKTPTSP